MLSVDVLTLVQQKRKKAIEDGWEYARFANLPYHLTEHWLDLARRRRWHRKMVALNAGKPAVFYFEGEKKDKVCTCEMCSLMSMTWSIQGPRNMFGTRQITFRTYPSSPPQKKTLEN